MCKKICEKTLFNILVYRMHKRSFDNFAIRHEKMNLNKISDDNTFNWIKTQSKLIDEKGLKNWLQYADGAKGLPPHLTMNSRPFIYTINFRNNNLYP